MKIQKILFPVMFATVAAMPAHAFVINSITGGGESLAFSPLNQFTAGPVSENGFTFTSTHRAVYGYTSDYNLNGNGSWNGSAGSFIGLNTFGASQFMTITFDNAVSSAVAFLNYGYIPDYYNQAYIAAYDEKNTLIESFTLSISTPIENNGGEDWGFGYSSPIIKSIVFGDAFIVAKNIRVSRNSSIPEPSSLTLLLAGVFGLGFVRRLQRK